MDQVALSGLLTLLCLPSFPTLCITNNGENNKTSRPSTSNKFQGKTQKEAKSLFHLTTYI